MSEWRVASSEELVARGEWLGASKFDIENLGAAKGSFPLLYSGEG
jgi:hypothetical protein